MRNYFTLILPLCATLAVPAQAEPPQQTVRERCANVVGQADTAQLSACIAATFADMVANDLFHFYVAESRKLCDHMGVSEEHPDRRRCQEMVFQIFVTMTGGGENL